MKTSEPKRPLFLPLKTAASATSTFETSRGTVDVGTFYIALGPLLKTSFQRVCFKVKAMRTLQHLRLWPSQTNHPIWQEAGVRITRKTVEYTSLVHTLRRCRKVSDGSFWKNARSKAPTAVPDLREAPLRCCCNGMENEPATWRSGCKRWCGNQDSCVGFPTAYFLR